MIPDPEAESVAKMLAEMTDVQHQVLMESLDGMESGRTICGPDTVMGPTGRGFKSVDVNWCPNGGGGMIHGGGGHDFESPEHSLVDIAIILFHDPKASLVVGSDASDMFMEPSDVDAARQAFRDALGKSVESSKETAMALASGETRSPPTARRKFRQRYSSCFRTLNTDHNESSPAQVPALAPQGGKSGFISPGERAGGAAMNIRQVLGSVFEFDLAKTNINLAQLLADEVITAVVLAVVLDQLGQ